MINVYIRATPMMAQALLRWQKTVRVLAEQHGNIKAALRYAAANDARAVANAMFDAEALPPILSNADAAALEPAQVKLLLVELERLQLDPAVLRNHIDELELSHRRFREQAAQDIADLTCEREAAMREGVELDKALRELIDRWSRAGDHETLTCAKDVLELIGPGEKPE